MFFSFLNILYSVGVARESFTRRFSSTPHAEDCSPIQSPTTYCCEAGFNGILAEANERGSLATATLEYQFMLRQLGYKPNIIGIIMQKARLRLSRTATTTIGQKPCGVVYGAN